MNQNEKSGAEPMLAFKKGISLEVSKLSRKSNSDSE